MDCCQDLFLLNRHCPWLACILPQASAKVSNTRSYRNSGLEYGFLAGLRGAFLFSAEGWFF